MLQKTLGAGEPGGRVWDFLWHKERRLLVFQASSQSHEEGQRRPHLLSTADRYAEGAAGSGQPPEISSSKTMGLTTNTPILPVIAKR